jgi:hypothetical protein
VEAVIQLGDEGWFRQQGAAVFLGPALGFFIGLISGFSVLLLIRTAAAGRATLKATLAEITQLLAIPTFCFGGPWLTSSLFTTVDLDDVLPTYAISLSLTFALVAGYPLIMLIRLTCDSMAQKGTEQ